MISTMSDIVDFTSLTSIVTFICQAALVLGAVFPYIPQYLQISRTGDAEGFSLYVCLALLTANILRILFWFGRGFETPLLLQSILMTIVMLIMIHLCVFTKAKSDIIKKTDRTFRSSSSDSGNPNMERKFTDFNMSNFWDWTDFGSYVQCLSTFSFVGALMMYTFSDSRLFVETVGFLAVFVEAMLGVPQFTRNFKHQSTRGMNRTMVMMWTCGDVFKTVYFISREAPIQFTICGCLQTGVDLAILTQIWWYGGRPGNGS